MKRSFCVSLGKCPDGVFERACEVLSDLGFTFSGPNAVRVDIIEGDKLTVKKTDSGAVITYSRKNEIYRALSLIERCIAEGNDIEETAKYTELTYMMDASRNAVPNLTDLKRFIRLLATLGYDSLMLYTEDTYELPGYPYFGHMRGRYTEAELKQIDEYSYSFGIELIPCIQTLAHVMAAIRWFPFANIKDNSDVLLAGAEETYTFIRAELEQCKRCFRSKRIHIGMDEAVGIGRGQYLDRNGYRNPSLIFSEHLARVLEICHEYSYEPMIWSDTFFREALGRYYVTEGEFSDELISKLPKDVDMVYWDYYHDDPVMLDKMMELHKSMRCPVVFAGGGRKWDGFASNNHRSLVCSAAQLDYCEKYGIDRIIFTAWGDCTAEASTYLALPTAILFAERCYSDASDKALDERARSLFGLSFEDLLAFDLLNLLPGRSQNVTNAAKYLLYNDPLERLMDAHMDRNTVAEAYLGHSKKLHALTRHEKFGYIYKTLALLSDVLTLKADLGWRLYDAYGASDKKALSRAAKDIPVIIKRLRKFIVAFREQWYTENKTMGFAPQDLRIGGLIERLGSAKATVDAYVSGKIDRIEELEYAPLTQIPDCDQKYIHRAGYETMFTAAVME